MKRQLFAVGIGLCLFLQGIATPDFPSNHYFKSPFQSVVTGKVTNPGGEPLSAVTVTAKGTKTVTVTDINGDFSIQMPAGVSKLVFTYVGHEEQEVNVSGLTTVSIQLKPADATLSDVIVIGYGEEDLDFAIANLPDVKYNGHAVKGSAQGIKVRVLLTQQKWADAATLAQQIISAATGKFGLSNNYASIFKTAGQSTAAVNQEIMFSTQYFAPTIPQRTSPGAAGMDIELGWYSLMQPYKNLVDDYEMTDGKSITESPLYNAATPYLNRDPRLDLTIKVPGEVWKNPTTNVNWTGSYVPATTFITEKYVDLTRAPFTTTTATLTDQDYVHLRYADILLMYAEAKNEATGPDATVYAAIDQVRGRAGIAMPATDQVKYATKETLRDYIRHERRVEFALEGQRYNDLKRWNIAHVKLPTLVTPANVPLKFETKNYVLPFQQSELDNNPQLVQNDNY